MKRNKAIGMAIWLIFFLIIGLKITGVIKWSWYWITSPLWGFMLISILISIIGVIIWLIRNNKNG